MHVGAQTERTVNAEFIRIYRKRSFQVQLPNHTIFFPRLQPCWADRTDNPNVAKAGGEKRWPEIGPILKFTIGLFLAKRFNAV
jgi:hypothetical protein